MHAVGCRPGLADHSSTKRANRCSIASTKRRGSDWFKLGRQSGDLLMEPEEREKEDEDRVRDMQRVKEKKREGRRERVEREGAGR